MRWPVIEVRWRGGQKMDHIGPVAFREILTPSETRV